MSIVRQDGAHVVDGASNGSRRDWELGAGLPRFLSIIIPAKNEAASLPQLVEEVASAFRPLLHRREGGNALAGFEVLIIDDGSTDETNQVLHQLTLKFPELRPLRLKANAGQSAATLAGFHAARGAWVAILDADLQNDPADLAKLWDALPGHDAGLGWRVKRRDVWTKRWISKCANATRKAILGDTVRDTGCAVRIFPRVVALRFPMFQGAHRFYGPFLLREGCSIVQVPCNHRPRPHGSSHYNIWNRSIKVVVDLLGVAWLMRRAVRYELAETPTDPATTMNLQGPVAASRALAASPEAQG
jgi:glycosyltransferase involved in cell wall biosynthesis